MISYTYPITRYGELETTIKLNCFTEKKRDVMKFYERDVTNEDIKRILKGYHDGQIVDVFNYIRDNLVLRDPSLHQCKYFELMGDCRFYEGITKIDSDHYYVDLGS